MKPVRIANRVFRRSKVWFITRRPPVLTWAFFRLLSCADWVVSARILGKQKPCSEEEAAWRDRYAAYCRDHAGEICRLQTAAPVARESDDHKHPRGAAYDSSTNPRFNAKLYAQFEGRTSISVLDLGCAGGGFVRSILKDGHCAVGIEGSDVPGRFGYGEWRSIPNHLFTADLTKPFTLTRCDGTTARFDAVTAWEVLEHIEERDLGVVLDNIVRHLAPGGYFVCSIDTWPDENPLTGARYHRTLKPREWWEELCRSRGLRTPERRVFEAEDMVRGNGLSLKDWHPDDGGGFHLVLCKPLM